MANVGVDPQTITTANNILKEIYSKGWFESFNNQTVLLSRLQRRTRPFAGKQWVFPIKAHRNFGFGGRNETGTYTGSTPSGPYLPAPGHVDWQRGVLTPVQYWNGFKITGSALKRAARDGSLVDLLGEEMNDLKSSMTKMVNQDLYLSGNGQLATVSTGANSATQTLSTVKYLEVGQPIVFAKTDTTGAVERVIQSIDESAGTITVDSAVDTTSGTWAVYRHGLNGSNAAAVVGVSGLGLIFDNTQAYAGISNRDSTNDWFAANTLDGSGGLSIDLMFQAVHQVDKKAGGKTSLIVTSYKQWRRYGLILAPDRRFSGASMRLDGGFGALPFTGGPVAKEIPVVPDHDCPDDKMYFLDESTFSIVENSPIEFMDEDNTILHRVGTGATAEYAFEARLMWFIQLECVSPIRNLVINNLP